MGKTHTPYGPDLFEFFICPGFLVRLWLQSVLPGASNSPARPHDTGLLLGGLLLRSQVKLTRPAPFSRLPIPGLWAWGCPQLEAARALTPRPPFVADLALW